MLVRSNFLETAGTWPSIGRSILATYDDNSIIVYQAFNADIASYAVAHQTFAGCPQYNPTRMTWIKTNFLWMMYRCGWCTKDANQTRVLAIRISRDGFEEILRRAVATTSHAAKMDAADFKKQLSACDVRLQWDPDHNPDGSKQCRRAIQLGLKGVTAQQFVQEWTLSIEDITDTWVTPQAKIALSTEVEARSSDCERRGSDEAADDSSDASPLQTWKDLMVPFERVYRVSDASLAAHIGLDADDLSN